MTKISLLLSNPSVCLRLQILTKLLNKDAGDREVQELRESRYSDPIVQSLLRLQNSDGSFKTDILTASSYTVQSTSMGLVKLGFLGFDYACDEVKKGIDYLFSCQCPDGSWDYPQGDNEDENYDMIPLQTAFPLWGLASVGMATDSRSEAGYEWLLSKQLDDGAWPTGSVGENKGFVAGYRKLPNSKWGCRANTTGSLLAFSFHPDRKNDSRIKRGLDMLLGRHSLDSYSLGFNVARFIGIEPSKGFFSFFATHDLSIVLNLVWKIGGGLQDKRIKKIVDFILQTKGPLGLWDYSRSPLATHWLTFYLLQSLSNISDDNNRGSTEPILPFQAYGKKVKRY